MKNLLLVKNKNEFSLEKTYNQVLFYKNLIKKLNYKAAFLCDSLDAKYKLEKCISGKFIEKNSLIVTKNCDPPKSSKNIINYKNANWKNIDTVFILRNFSIEGFELSKIVTDLKKKNKDIAICDQTAHVWEIWNQNDNLNFYFRKVKIEVSKNKLIPSYYFNDPFINKILKTIKKNKYKSVLDMCCGSGTIGLSVFKETKLKSLTMSDIDSSISKSIKASLNLNNFSLTRVKLIISDGFKNFKKNEKYDLIALNPPFFNFQRTKNNHLNGHDYKFEFNKNFFKFAGDFLKPKGQILFIKPIDNSVKGVLLDSDIQKFINNGKLKLKNKFNIKGSHYCIFLLGLKNE